jgi:hypothetical protein
VLNAGVHVLTFRIDAARAESANLLIGLMDARVLATHVRMGKASTAGRGLLGGLSSANTSIAHAANASIAAADSAAAAAASTAAAAAASSAASSLAMEVAAATHRPAFIASNAFEGAKMGMVFQNGALGIGYYPDASVGAPSSSTSLPRAAGSSRRDLHRDLHQNLQRLDPSATCDARLALAREAHPIGLFISGAVAPFELSHALWRRPSPRRSRTSTSAAWSSAPPAPPRSPPRSARWRACATST